ncbi:hypothetical protein AURDEDRAFT_165158 [Auricularia subglabra TFB-10046 SS5]|nr:hypothetical protein AURDEDRAFT_165158 [Auricularia subglabra TFB-10046 SS5]
MYNAYNDFSSGVALLYQTKGVDVGPELQVGPSMERTAQGCSARASVVQVAVTASDTIVPMTNGALSDLRVFHVDHSNFSKCVNGAVVLESKRSHTFKETDPRELLLAIKARLRQGKGWDASAAHPVPTRKSSVAMTVRIWLMQAILAWKIDESHERACTLFRRAIEFLELGRREWAKVTVESRGTIFEITFLLIIERAYLECCVEMFLTRAFIEASGPSTILETIKAAADRIITQTNQIPHGEKTPIANPDAPGRITFMVYPEAVAHDAIALYHRTKANEATSTDEEQNHLSRSIDSLSKSIALYPTDEELRCGMMVTSCQETRY